MHNRIHELAPYNVASGYGHGEDHSSSAAGASGLVAPTQSYDHLGNALADYDMQ